jgi:hypothetical protein
VNVILVADDVHRDAFRYSSSLDIKFRLNYVRHNIGKTGNAGFMAFTGAHV